MSLTAEENATEAPAARPRRFVVAVCTARRPGLLERCLVSLTALEAPDGADVAIAVVENDAAPASREVVDRVAADTSREIRYVLEPRRGIPFARNRALALALDMGADWIALIDDDESADPDWLVKLDGAATRFGADVANGPVRRVYEVREPHWWKGQRQKARATGTRIPEAPTNNVLISARLVRPDGLGLSFDERLTYGSEDMDFFRRADRAGAHMIWVDDAFVEEYIPASRVTTRRLLSRLHMAAASGAFNMVLSDGRGRAALKFVPKSARRIVLGALAVPVGAGIALVAKQRGEKILYYGLTRIAKGTGNVRGLLGVAHRYYDQIDGH